MALSERDKNLIKQFGLSEQQVEEDARTAESETQPDPLVGKVYYGLHLAKDHEPMKTITVRLPEDLVSDVTTKAHRYGISRNEYIRRKLAA